MASYHYDEAGTMALYFVITFLFLLLVPLTLSLSTPSRASKMDLNACQCQECIDRRTQVRKHEGGFLSLQTLSRKTWFVIGGWTLFAFLSYKVSTTQIDSKVYDPFDILGISTSSTEKEIKSRYRKLSKLFHPDKVKLAVNQTMEEVEAKFVELTKAYKSLTDETIRKNWELYGHPDGRQEIIMGIALPKWIIEGKNNIWVLGAYGLVFGGALPAVVGQWWFGNRRKTKDGVEADTAATFFKAIKEEAGAGDVLAVVAPATPRKASAAQDAAEIGRLEAKIREQLAKSELVALPKDEKNRRALVLVYAHLLRLPVESASLQKEQTDLLVHTPSLLSALLNIVAVRNWLAPTLAAMRLHACVTQAIPPGQPKLKFAQLPGVSEKEALDVPNEVETLDGFVDMLEERGDARVGEVRKAVERIPRLEVVDVAFKVIGERIVTPLAIIHLVLKLRLSSPGSSSVTSESTRTDTAEDERIDLEFLNSRKDAEDIGDADTTSGWAHAPHWPGIRKPGWWVVLADDKTNRLVQPPMKISDVPFSDPRKSRDYRSYRMQFQAPQGVGVYTWKVYLVSDTFVGEVVRDVMLKVDDVAALNADEQGYEDEISDPEEDSLAGQMAAMRGHSVKKQGDGEDESDDDESSTDDEKGRDDSSSDSD
ncbi:DnaJ-domain-containing protein [Neolentinus lepideus HHB14362 ss-1]|uniref:DnaJ-domain-containing protein n=1 Tax=Neolentinus lepideus HHB14362 ss-1 TaxID=1314782 RepID=A0A165PLY2_9AGAM|nr:DnaJ-domain-containing protein [Neolentinus lepideus HHB14362 ss-1]